MKTRYVIIMVVASAFIFGSAGYFVGKTQYKNYAYKDISQEEIIDYKEQYKQGWSYWFSGYGMNGEGVQYVNYFQYGRKYNEGFQDNHEAFITGYNDAFFYVNKSEPSGYAVDDAEKGYKEYYPD